LTIHQPAGPPAGFRFGARETRPAQNWRANANGRWTGLDHLGSAALLKEVSVMK
jgi:hypothetical protein